MENPFTELEKKILQRFDTIEGILKADLRERTGHDRTGGIKLAMEVTGLKKQTIYKLSQRRLIPCSKPEGTKLLIFREAELIKWIEQGKMPLQSDINNAAFTDLRKL